MKHVYLITDTAYKVLIKLRSWKLCIDIWSEEMYKTKYRLLKVVF